MAFLHRPEYITENEHRCEALVRGQKSSHYVWQRFDRRCVRRINQMRDGHQVCFQHAEVKRIEYFSE